MVDIPLNELLANPASYLSNDTDMHTYVVCRLGNDSQLAVDALRSVCSAGAKQAQDETALSVIKDLRGGLKAWAKEGDDTFPVY